MRISDWSSDVCSSDLDRGDRIIVEPAGVAECLTFEPMVVKLDPEHVEAVEAEGMDIAMAGTDPVDEFDPELVGRVVSRTNSSSSMPSSALNRQICGIVASPTPTVPIASLSISSLSRPRSEEHTAELQSLMR